MIDKLFLIFKRYKSISAIVLGGIIGFGVSSGLLFYSGKELVNSLIYLGIVVFIPFIFSLISIGGILIKRDKIKLESLLLSYLFGVAFSTAALISLLFIVTTQDIAFGWATTLNITPDALSAFLNKIAIWKSFCSSCTVDRDLADISQFIRLGGEISKEQISNAKLLGAWWKYLSASIIFYGIIFRAILYAIVKYLIKSDEIKIESQENSETLEDISNSYLNRRELKELKDREFRVVGYYITPPSNLKESSEAKDILIVVKSWEPPIMDFFDYLDELKDKNPTSNISIYLLGLKGRATKDDIDIWLRKLNELKLNYEVIV